MDFTSVYIGTVAISLLLASVGEDNFKFKLDKEGYKILEPSKEEHEKNIVKHIAKLAIPGFNLLYGTLTFRTGFVQEDYQYSKKDGIEQGKIVKKAFNK